MYVGHGVQDRPWQFHNRDKEHKKWLKSKFEEGFTLKNIVEITYSHCSAEEAKQGELYLIELHRPKFNKNYDFPTKFTKETFIKARSLREQGYSYKDIGLELDLSPMTIHRALNRKVKAHDKWS